MKFIEKSINHINKMFPAIYEGREKRGSFHFALALERNTIITVGLNKPDRVDSRAFKNARRLNLEDKLKFPYYHAEEDMIGKLIGMNKLSPSLNIVVLRLNRFGKLGESAPCSNCSEILKAYGLHRVWWSTREGIVRC